MRFSYKYLLSLIFLYTSTGLWAQTKFICDTTGIADIHDTVMTFSCNYYYNYIKQKKDSVLAADSVSLQPITFKGILKNGKLNGPVAYYNHQSNIVQQGFMKDGLADSTFITYHISLSNYKIIDSKTKYKNGSKDGEEIEYNEGGVITYIRNYKAGILDGEYKHYDGYGTLLTSGFYKEGKRESTWIEYFSKEHYSIYKNYKNDELIDYKWISYHDNGKPFFEGTYDKNNKKQGVFKTYNSDGVLIITETYKDGMRNGFSTEYFNGQPVKKTKYKDDKIITN